MGQFAEIDGISESTIQALRESYLLEEAYRLPDKELADFLAPGGMADAFVEAGFMKKKTLVRLTKQDDLERRRMMAAIQLAFEGNDPLFDKLTLNRQKEKELLGKISKKYNTKAEKAAKIAQREYAKAAKKVPSSFMKMGGAERL